MASDLLNSFSLEGKVAIVTGASSGLGVAFATGLAEAGADIAIGARRVEKLEKTKEQVEALGRRCIALPCDVSKPDDCTKLVEETVSQLGKADVLINNAGVGTAYPATRETPEQFDEVIRDQPQRLVLHGAGVRPQHRRGRRRDREHRQRARLDQRRSCRRPPTRRVKAAIIGLTRDLAVQWTGRKKIRVNALAPGFFESEMTDQYPDGYLDQMMFRVPMGRKGEARELVAAAIFLASDASAYITGVLLPVDGGLLTT